MSFVGTAHIRSYEKGLLFRRGEFAGVLDTGRHWFVDPTGLGRIDVVSQRDPWLMHDQLDVIVKSGALRDKAIVLDLGDSERALVWVDGRFNRVLLPGRHALWTGYREVRTEIVDARQVRFKHPELDAIMRSPGAEAALSGFVVEPSHSGLYFLDGSYVETLAPGRYAFWKNSGKVTLHHIDLREKLLDLCGQDIMTSDKVTVRLNAVLTYRVTDPMLSVTRVEDECQALYRDAQLALRTAVGSRDLDTLLSDKDGLATALEGEVRERAKAFGIGVASLGIRDIILPGDMRTLLNKVTEAKKAAEANLITRREETAAIRSQANTARLLDENPTLMRLRELEVLARIAETSKLNIVLGEKGLAERVVNLL